jgi:hypothetical protein
LEETERRLKLDVPFAPQLTRSFDRRNEPRRSALNLESSNVGSSDGTMTEPTPEFDRDEVLVCMVLAFCLAGASVSVIYGVMS